MANESVQPCSTSIQSEAKLFSPRTKIVLQGGIISIPTGGCCDHDHMVVGLQLPVQSVPITTQVVTSNPTYCDTFYSKNLVLCIGCKDVIFTCTQQCNDDPLRCSAITS